MIGKREKSPEWDGLWPEMDNEPVYMTHDTRIARAFTRLGLPHCKFFEGAWFLCIPRWTKQLSWVVMIQSREPQLCDDAIDLALRSKEHALAFIAVSRSFDEDASADKIIDAVVAYARSALASISRP